jgi:hypothetical protein
MLVMAAKQRWTGSTKRRVEASLSARLEESGCVTGTEVSTREKCHNLHTATEVRRVD